MTSETSNKLSLAAVGVANTDLTLAMPTRKRTRFPVLHSLFRRKLALIGMIVITAVIAVAIFAPFLAPQDPTLIKAIYRLKGPGWQSPEGKVFILGTDTIGRDVLSRLIFGSRISLIVGLTVVLVAGSLGVVLGLTAGFLGGFWDDLIMRVADIFLAFPFILLAISVLAVLGSGVWKLVAVLGLTGWVSYTRIVRSEVISLREKEFVQASRSVGSGTARIMFRHVLPNVWASVIIIASFSVATTIISEASLSFLGLGVPPDVPTWGAMLADGREYLERAPWLVIYPGLAIALLVLSINVVGDWVRDYLDPHLKNAR